MKIKVTRKDDQITVEASVPHYDEYNCRKKIRINTAHVLEALALEGHKNVGNIIREGSINNKRRNTDVWIFQDTTPKRKKAAPTPKKSKKTLDNSSKDVIISSKHKI